MSTNQTEHYGLHLWEPEDAFLRAEFNENSERTDAAIKEVADYAAANRKALEPMGRNLYDLLLLRYFEGKQKVSPQGLIFNTFQSSGWIASMTEGMYLGEEGLYLSGPNTVGTMTALTLDMDHKWSRAIAWIHYYTGTVTAAINGKPMTHQDMRPTYLPDGRFCIERTLLLEEPGPSTVTISLTVQAPDYDSPAKIYGYGVMFF